MIIGAEGFAGNHGDEYEGQVAAMRLLQWLQPEHVSGRVIVIPVLSVEASKANTRSWPSGANFILFRPRQRPGREVWEALLDRDVLVRDCSSWPRLDGCLRVTIGTPAEDDAFLAALEEALS